MPATATVQGPPTFSPPQGGLGGVSSSKEDNVLKAVITAVSTYSRQGVRAFGRGLRAALPYAAWGAAAIGSIALIVGLAALNIMFGAWLFSVSSLLGWAYVGWCVFGLVSSLIATVAARSI